MAGEEVTETLNCEAISRKTQCGIVCAYTVPAVLVEFETRICCSMVFTCSIASALELTVLAVEAINSSWTQINVVCEYRTS
jgi:hypothetical protein